MHQLVSSKVEQVRFQAINKNSCNSQWLNFVPLIVFLSLTLASQNTLAQNTIPSNQNTFAIMQDHQGFIWTTGHNGIMRLSGESAITFNSNNDNWVLPFNWVNNFSQLSNHKFLLATETHQLWLFDPNTGDASNIPINIHRKSIYHAIEYADAYYINAPDILYKVDPNTNITKLLAENLSITDLKKTAKHLYIATRNSLLKLTSEKSNNDKLISVLNEPITALETTKNFLIAATQQQLIIISDEGMTRNIAIHKKVQAIAKCNNADYFFTVDDNGKIKKYSLKTLKEVAHLYPDTEIKKTRAMLHDTSGVLWLLSSQGVKRFTPVMTKNYSKIFDVAINGIELATLKGELIIGSYGAGLSAQNSHHPINSPLINQQLSKKAKIITKMLVINDFLYISTFDGLWRYNPKDLTVERVNFKNNTNLLIDITTKNNLLYLATNYNGFLIYDINKEAVVLHVTGERLSSKETINLLPLDNGSIWVANTNGVDIYNTQTDTIRHLKGTGQNKVISLLEYNNKIFAATKGDGIFVFNYQGELLSHFAKNLSFGFIALIKGKIWAPAQPGLYKIDPDSYQLTLIPNTEQYAFTSKPIVSQNTLYIGHYGGILEVPLTENIRFNPKVYISKTIVSGKSYLRNKSIKVQSSNDVITIELASLDFRPGKEKQYKYQVNNGLWHKITGHTLTLTGLASGLYNLEIMATNSLGQWSNNKAYTEIYVAYPWYWTPQIRVLYGAILLFIISVSCWLLYLRAKSISHIHQLLKSDLKNKGKSAQQVVRNLSLAIDFIEKKEPIEKIKQVIQQSIEALNENETEDAPNSLFGKSLHIALPFFSEYVHKKYHINVITQLDISEELLSYEMQADIYKIIYEATTSGILNGQGRNFKISVQEFKGKLWLTISDDSHSFTNFNNKINFDMAMYYIRQIATKYNASVNTFDEEGKGSQLVISIPLMKLS